MSRASSLRNGAKSGGRQRNSGQGATRKNMVQKKPARSFAWVNRLLILLGVGVVFAALVKAFLVLDAIPVEHIVVTGKLEHTQTLALQEMVQPALIGGFLRADLGQIQAQLESLPWVYEASVRRQWPNALEIHVVEQLPIARWGKDGFLNHEGQVFHPSAANTWESLPMLSGTEGSEQSLIGDYQFISEVLGPLGLAVVELVADDRGQLRATLSGDIELVLGDIDLAARLDRFVVFYNVGPGERRPDIRRVDMRYQSGVAVTFSESPEVAGL